jgi:hypothetical protein
MTHFSVANAGFEGGDNGHGYGDYIFLVIYAQPSHNGHGRWSKATALS